jgi:twitching motility protein PilI
MANREALRELQTRLAARLQAAQSEGMAVAWLAVTASGQNYLLPLSQAGEIFPFANLQPVPYAKEWFLGVLNVRGSLFGVVDLAAFVALDLGRARPSPGVLPSEFSVVTLNGLLDVNCALQIDTLVGLRGSDAFVSTSPPAEDARSYYGNQFVDVEGGSWQEINLRSLAQSPQFLSISA